jgi:predicted RNA-binding Zn-ribbon protein involved in translation (DUF1610 family)
MTLILSDYSFPRPAGNPGRRNYIMTTMTCTDCGKHYESSDETVTMFVDLGYPCPECEQNIIASRLADASKQVEVFRSEEYSHDGTDDTYFLVVRQISKFFTVWQDDYSSGSLLQQAAVMTFKTMAEAKEFIRDGKQ